MEPIQAPHPARKIFRGAPKRFQFLPLQKLSRDIAFALRRERERAQQVMRRTGVSALAVPLKIYFSPFSLAIEQGGHRRQAKDDGVAGTSALGLRRNRQKPQFLAQV